MMANQWFRLYSRIMTDPKIEMLSFEDQRHFVWILCMKNEGYLDQQLPSKEAFDRMVARKLGLQGEAFVNAKLRLMEVGLIGDDWQPLKWSSLQFVSDHDVTSKERQKRYREKQRNALCNASRNVTVTPLEQNRTDTDTEQITPPTPPPKPKPPKKPPTDERAFAAFWCEYPKKVGKQDAKKAWDKLAPSPELAREIISHVQTRRQSDEQWNRDNGRAIPHPATFLNGKRWEDVYLVREQSFAERLAASRSSPRRSDFGEDGADIREAMDLGF